MIKSDEDYDKRLRFHFWLTVIIIALVVLFTFWIIESGALQSEGKTSEVIYNDLFLDGRYFPHYIPNTAVYGTMTGSENDLYWKVWLEYPELFDIITCESGWRPEVCNEDYGCRSGQGLAQFIPTTWKYIQDKEVKVDDPFNIEDNLTAAIWLYSNEGNYHWKQSESCWLKQ